MSSIIKKLKSEGFTHLKIELETTYEDDSYLYDILAPMLKTYAKSKKINYWDIMDDCSCGAEATITAPLENWQVFKSIFTTLQQGFKEDGGDGLPDDRCGMHISIMRGGSYSEGCVIDISTDNHVVAEHDFNKLDNYIYGMTRAMLGYAFLANADWKTRPFYYARPFIDSQKYSGIHVLRGGFEFRSFEPCYSKPERLRDYLHVIANSIEAYYVEEKPTRFLRLEVPVYSNKKRTIDILQDMNTVQFTRFLRQVKLLKPAYLSVSDVLKQRGISDKKLARLIALNDMITQNKFQPNERVVGIGALNLKSERESFMHDKKFRLERLRAEYGDSFNIDLDKSKMVNAYSELLKLKASRIDYTVAPYKRLCGSAEWTL